MNKLSFNSKAVAVLLALLLWQLVSMAVGMDFLLVSPLQVLLRLTELCREPGFGTTLLFTLLHILAGFLLALLLGLGAALVAGRYPLVEALLWPYVVAIRSVPIASFIILCLIWLSPRQLTVFIAFLIAFPILYANVLQGIKTTDTQLLEMATLYHVPWRRKLHYIYLPSIRAYLLSACTVALGMVWKAGVAAEVIGVVQGSIGEKLYEAKIYFQISDLLAWTVMIILCSVVMEKGFLWLLQRFFQHLLRQ